MEADIAAKAVELGTNTDFSLFSLFIRADIIVKSVMILLILCSIYSWAVIIEKFRLFKKITKSSEEFEENSGTLNLLKLFIIVYLVNLRTQCHLCFKMQWKDYLKKNQEPTSVKE